MRRLALLAAALLTTAGPAAAEDPSTKAGPPPGSVVDPALQTKVDRAIERGVAWLRKLQEKDGEFPGPYDADELGALAGTNVSHIGQTALALYTLRACGVPFEDPGVAKGFAWLRAEYLRRKPGGLDNYGVSLTVLALETHHAPPPPPERDEDRYGRSIRPPPGIPEADLSWLRELTAWIVAAQVPDGGFGYVSPGRLGYDHSNTQYSLLALKAARRCGIPVPDEVWRKALRHLLRVQEKDGPTVLRRERKDGGGTGYAPTSRAVARDRARGWGYFEYMAATGSMTTGGVSSVAICRNELRGRPGFSAGDDATAEQAMHDGIAWLGRNFTVRRNPAPPRAPMGAEHWHYYYLYGLERAGVLAEVALMGDHDWYREGAEYLVGEQGKHGGWGSDDRLTGLDSLPEPLRGVLKGKEMLDTCFALLFLKRATARLGRGVATGEEIDLSGATSLGDRELRALFDRVFGRFAAAPESRRAALAADFVRLGARSIPLLVMRLEDPDAAARAAALDALRAVTGETCGFDPAAPDEQRAAAIARWEEWWHARRDRLEPDPASGRFVEKPR